eukprot:22583-Pyramimonas_sp.AAC.2
MVLSGTAAGASAAALLSLFAPSEAQAAGCTSPTDLKFKLPKMSCCVGPHAYRSPFAIRSEPAAMPTKPWNTTRTDRSSLTGEHHRR